MNTIWNPSVAELYKFGIQDENLEVSSTGALLAYSGEKTGRSPKDKRVVYDENTKNIWWSSNPNDYDIQDGANGPNIPITKELFEFYSFKAKEYLESKDKVYVIDTYAGWINHDDKQCKNHEVKIRIYCTLAYHALFMENMLIPSDKKFNEDEIDFTIYNVGEISLKNYIPPDKNKRDDSLKDTLIGIDFTEGEMIIYGTKYAGEMKKGVLTLMMYLMPIEGYLTLHSSANLDINTNQLSLFFGLSGTGKTTLSADPCRSLIGDDEHVWTNTGVFNIEGGCYAKCIGLKKEFEPEIYDAIRYGAVVENVVYDKDTHAINFDDGSITQNTRCSYPLNYIPNALIPATVNIHPKNIIFLTCDAFGILPPVSKLSPDQAVYFFVNGYTSKIPGTEMGITEDGLKDHLPMLI
jgi:phosphoenolpyruvate carboxykinase (ATP)